MKLPKIDIPDLLWENRELLYGGESIGKLARITGTPAFIYREERIMDNVRRFKAAFRPAEDLGLHIAYSAKTAWEPKLLALLARLGVGVEVASLHEMELCLNAGFPIETMYLDGPAHTADDLIRSLSLGVHSVKVDSAAQLDLVADTASSHGTFDVSLRIKAPGSRWIGGPAEGLGRRFGFDGDGFRHALSVISQNSALRLRGIAVHIGSQITGPRSYRRAMKALSSACSTAFDAGLKPREADIGGGFPSRSLGSPSIYGLVKSWFLGHGGRVPEIEAFGKVITDELREISFPESVTKILVEPGRSLVSDAAVLVTGIRAQKPGWLFVDASRNFVPEALIFAARRFFPARPRHSLPWKRVNISGPTLSGGDVLAIGSRLPNCEVGELLVMPDAGAYTLSKANRFTTLIPPAYLMDGEGNVSCIRRRETTQDVVREAESW